MAPWIGALHEDACHLGPNVPACLGSRAVCGMVSSRQPATLCPVVRLKQLDV